MLDIHWLELVNFRSFAGQHKIELPLSAGLYHLTGQNDQEPRLGANGVGKSTLLDAVYWALYGRTTRGLKAGDVVTWGERSCSVTVSMTIGAAKIRIKRTQTPNTLTLNDQTISQEDLQAHLRLGPDAFTYAVMIPQFGESFFDLAPSAKLTLFSQIMELDYWLDRSKAAEDLANEVSIAKLEVERQINRYRGQLETIDEDVNNLTVKQTEFASAQATAIKRLKQDLLDLKPDKAKEAIEFAAKALANIEIKIKGQGKILEKCPECGQSIENADYQALLRNKSDFEGQLRRFQREQASIEGQSSALKASIKREQERTNPYQHQIDEKLANKKAAEVRLKKLVTEVEGLNSDHSAASYWVTGFKRIRLLVVEQTLRQLELEVNNNMTSLGLADWRIEFDVERENKSGGVTKGFVVFVYAPDRAEPTRWEAWSGGETQRLRLAGDLGLANLIMERAGLRGAIEFYDEPSRHLSQEGLLDVAETLHQRALLNSKRIFLVDHAVIDFGDFAGRLRITKGLTGSRLI